MGIGSWLWMLAWIVLVVGSVLLIVWAIGASAGSGRDDEAIQILRARYARGEIDADQFETARQTLGLPASRATRSRGLLLLGLLLLTSVATGVLALAGSGGFGGMMDLGMMGIMGPAPTAPIGTSVTMAGSRFTPPTLSIKVGDTVRWFNDDSLPHTVTATDRAWDSGNLSPGGSFERRFDAPGTHAYGCRYHPWMVATVVVSGP